MPFTSHSWRAPCLLQSPIRRAKNTVVFLLDKRGPHINTKHRRTARQTQTHRNGRRRAFVSRKIIPSTSNHMKIYTYIYLGWPLHLSRLLKKTKNLARKSHRTGGWDGGCWGNSWVLTPVFSRRYLAPVRRFDLCDVFCLTLLVSPPTPKKTNKTNNLHFTLFLAQKKMFLLHSVERAHGEGAHNAIITEERLSSSFCSSFDLVLVVRPQAVLDRHGVLVVASLDANVVSGNGKALSVGDHPCSDAYDGKRANQRVYV